jgi:hypothetical protein
MMEGHLIETLDYKIQLTDISDSFSHAFDVVQELFLKEVDDSITLLRAKLCVLKNLGFNYLRILISNDATM